MGGGVDDIGRLLSGSTCSKPAERNPPAIYRQYGYSGCRIADLIKSVFFEKRGGALTEKLPIQSYRVTVVLHDQ